MNYLKYIEHSAENLQFFLWYQDYSARWNKLPESDKVLAPEWTQAQAQAAEAERGTNASTRLSRIEPGIASVLKGSDFADGEIKVSTVQKSDPFGTPTHTSEDEKRDMMSDYGSSNDNSLDDSAAHRTAASQAFEDAGMMVKPCKSPSRARSKSFSGY